MPILEVEVVGEVAPGLRDGLARRIADAAGEALASRPQGTWVRLRFLAAGDYAENAGGPPPGDAPVFVAVLLAELPAAEPGRAELLARVTAAVAGACGRSVERVHVRLEPPARGRIAFGGRMPGDAGATP